MAREYKINASDYLQELGHSKYEIVQGEPDIRGWTVKDQYGKTIGEVEELLFDPQARKVRYLIVDLEGNVLDLEPRDVVVPIGLAELHKDDDDVILPHVTAAQLQMLPVYDRDTFNPEVENAIHRVFTGPVLASAAAAGTLPSPPPDYPPRDYAHDHFNERNLYRHRKARTVIGLFSDPGQARRAVDELSQNGISHDHMELAIRQAVDPARGYAPDRFDRFFDSLFLSPDEAGRYREKAQSSNAVVAVHTYSPEQARRAAGILEHHHPIDLSDAAGQHYATGTAPAADTTASLPAIEEKEHIGKQEEETGGARLRSRIIERPVEENLRLREERLRIERVPVNRPATGDEVASFPEGPTELNEQADIPIASEEGPVVEEINIEKVTNKHGEANRETAHQTDGQQDEFPKDDYRQEPRPTS